MKQVHERFSMALREAGLYYGRDHDQVVRSFLSSFATKPFVILTGLSGSGKTQIATRFGEWLGEEHSALIPVRPDWTGSEATFGYEDILQSAVQGRRAWHVPRPLQFILKAARNPNKPYLLILDEMNLAHVERYFADFLSGLESGKECLPNLRQEEDGTWRNDPAGTSLVGMPGNLWVVGTVNVDETTYMFSPKVLDRANTFEFRVGTEDLSANFRKPSGCRPAHEDLVDVMLKIARDSEWHLRNPAVDQEWFANQMRQLHRVLSGGGYEFGHRVFYEMIRFAAMMSSMGEQDGKVALDFQVLQKILPRLNGSRRELEPTLWAVGRFCYSLEAPDAAEETVFDPTEFDSQQAQLGRSFDKIQRMARKLRANQFVSFTE
jgi:5-methylcytosine-specific restriction protein B